MDDKLKELLALMVEVVNRGGFQHWNGVYGTCCTLCSGTHGHHSEDCLAAKVEDRVKELKYSSA